MTGKKVKTAIILPFMAFSDDWSQVARTDLTIDASMARTRSLETLLKEKGGFPPEILDMALIGLPYLPPNEDDLDEELKREYNADMKQLVQCTELVADWARYELSILRQLEEASRQEREGQVKMERSETPVLHGNAISRTLLSDLAIQLLHVGGAAGENLVMLFVELLNVDKHRATAANRTRPSMKIAAQFVAQDPEISNAELARLTERNKSTISRWRRDPDFSRYVENYKMALKNLKSGG